MEGLDKRGVSLKAGKGLTITQHATLTQRDIHKILSRPPCITSQQ